MERMGCVIFTTALVLLIMALPAAAHRLENTHLRLTVDDQSGRVRVERRDGRGFVVCDGRPMILMGEAAQPVALMLRQVKEEAFRDKLGTGRRLVIAFTHPQNNLQCIWRVQLYEKQPWVSLTADIKAANGLLTQLSPLTSRMIRAGQQGSTGQWRVFRNNGTNTSYEAHGSVALTSTPVTSHFLSAIYDPEHDEGIGLGFYSYHRASAQITWTGTPEGAELTAAGLYHGYDLKQGGGMTGESLLLDFSLDPLDALEHYVDATCRVVKPRFNHTVLPGLHNPWSMYGYALTPEIAQAERQQVSQTIFGKYYDHDTLAIDVLNFCVPDVVPSKEHPDWVIDGTVDYSNPAAREWVAQAVRELTQKGCRYLASDFNTAGPLSTSYDPTMVRGFEVPRAGMRTVRENLAPSALSGTYTTPNTLFLGLVDRVRISWDIVGDFTHLQRLVQDTAGCYMYHNRFWLNDIDPVMIQGNNTPAISFTMRPNEPRIRVAIGGIASTFLTTGDPIYAYTPEQERLLTLLLPALGKAARPLDLMRRDVPEEYLTTVKTKWDEWYILTYINLTKEEHVYSVDWARLGLKPGGKYLVYDFWPQQFLGRLVPGQNFRVAGEDTRCLLIRAVPRYPWILSTNMHYTQGAMDLADVTWHSRGQKLSGTAIRHPGAERLLTLYVPEGYRLKETSEAIEPTMRSQDPHVVYLKLAFREKELTWWALFAKE